MALASAGPARVAPRSALRA